MAATRGFTANMEAIQDFADRALEEETGVTLEWRTSDGYTPANARSRARSFQQGFASLRSRARTLSAKRVGNVEDIMARYQTIRGPYDRLACYIEEIPDDGGWRVILCPAQDLFDDVRVISNSTGKPLETIGRDADEHGKLISKAIYKRAHFTAEDWDELTALDHAKFPNEQPWHELMRFPRPSGTAPIKPHPLSAQAREAEDNGEQWGSIPDDLGELTGED